MHLKSKRKLFFVKTVLIMACLMIGALSLPIPSQAALTSCYDINLQPGNCKLDTCGGQQGCYCDVAPNTHLCCTGPVGTYQVLSKCYDKQTGKEVTSTSAAPGDVLSPPVLPPEEKKVTFKPYITLPGSKFISGQEIVITGGTFGEWISAVYVFFVGVAGILSTVMMMYGGVKYVVSFGNPQKFSDAQDQIISAMIGLALSVGAYMILLTINPELVKFKNLSLKPVSEILQPMSEATARSEKGAPAEAWSGTNINTYDANISTAAGAASIDRNLIKAIMFAESGGNPNAVSAAGACGLMQLLPSTASLSCEALKDPATNITAGAAYLATLVANPCPPVDAEHPCPNGQVCNANELKYAIAAYNGGKGANYCSTLCPGQTWWQCTQNGGYAETRGYVETVSGILQRIQDNPTTYWP